MHTNLPFVDVESIVQSFCRIHVLLDQIQTLWEWNLLQNRTIAQTQELSFVRILYLFRLSTPLPPPLKNDISLWKLDFKIIHSFDDVIEDRTGN